MWNETVQAGGVSVHVQERKSGRLALRWWNRTRKNWCWRSLRHNDKEKAVQQATQLAADLQGIAESEVPNITVRQLFARYELEVSRHKKGAQPKEDERRVKVWRHFLTPDRPVRTLDFPTINEFVRKRRRGQIRVPKVKLQKKPSETTVGADIVFLSSVLNWATMVRLPNGSPLLSENPIKGYKRPQTVNPKRPVATHDRFEKIREKANDVDVQGLFGPFLDLIVALGWRVSAVCKLQASDLDLSDKTPHGRIRKRGSVDKEGVEMWVPISQEARDAIDEVLQKNSVVGDKYLFPAPRRKGKPWRRFYARDLLHRAEDLAEIERLKGGDFHPYRRKWVTERKHLPDKDVAAAGGWKDLRTIQQCYQDVDEATMLAVATEPRRLRDAK